MRLRRVLVLLMVLDFCGRGAAHADPAASKNNEGNRLYDQKKLDEALKQYTDAQASRPGSPELHYNIGNVLYRKGQLDKAVEEYLRAQAAKDPRLAQAATFNRGNALLKQGRLQDAVNAYVQSLRARPDDRDAKRNLELALRLLKEQQKKQSQEPQPKDDPSKKPQESPQSASQQQGDRKPPAQKSPSQMSQEEARRILDALRDQEKEGVKKHAQATAPEERTPEEDW